MIKRLISSAVLVCFSFQLVFAGSGYIYLAQEIHGYLPKPETEVVVRMKNGSQLKGKITDINTEHIIIEHRVNRKKEVKEIESEYIDVLVVEKGVLNRTDIQLPFKYMLNPQHEIEVKISEGKKIKGGLLLTDENNLYVYADKSIQKIKAEDVVSVSVKKTGKSHLLRFLGGVGVGVLAGFLLLLLAGAGG